LFWGTISDRLGRLSAFRVLIGGQIVVFGLLMVTRNPWVFGCLICYVLLCYGGGFGTMPSLVLYVFGIRRMAVVYGAILTAWSAAGIIGPQIVATLKDHYPQTASMYCFGIGAVGLVVGLLLSLLVDDKPLVKERVEETTEGNPEVAVCELSR
jgi:OFA family oxalate/formate antiporter-like MFS transporter